MVEIPRKILQLKNKAFPCHFQTMMNAVVVQFNARCIVNVLIPLGLIRASANRASIAMDHIVLVRISIQCQIHSECVNTIDRIRTSANRASIAMDPIILVRIRTQCQMHSECVNTIGSNTCK